MSKVWIIIPAAGKSQRFIDAGYTKIKPLLELEAPDGKKDWMMNFVEDSVPKGYTRIIALPEGLKFSSEELGGMTLWECLESTLNMVEDRQFEKHWIQYIERTKGQADTIYQVTRHLPQDDSCLILDCDMILKTRDIQQLIDLLQVFDVTIAVTESFDPNASRIDQIPFPRKFVEKEPISQYAIVGARGFRSIDKLGLALEKTLDECGDKEPYLSMAINNYEGSKFALMITEFTDLGTPKRIEEAGWKIV